VIGRPDGVDVHLRIQRAPELVGGKDVQAVVLDDRRCAGHRVEHALHARPHLLRCAAARALGRRVRCACEVEQVGAFGVVELERPGERFEHAVGGAGDVSAFQARVVLDADAGQGGDLLAAQPRNAATAVGRQPCLLGRDPGAAGGEELADLLLGLHEAQVRPGSRPSGGPCQ
jgi:hypothetical protein